MADQLLEFFRNKIQQAPPSVDWESKKARWLQSVDRLYGVIKNLLQAPIRDRLVEVDEIPVVITEKYVGKYQATDLRLRVGNASVVFSPKGVNVVGAAGRVDLSGDCGDVTLVLEGEDTGKEEWKVILQRVPKRVAAPLDERTLRAALERVMQ